MRRVYFKNLLEIYADAVEIKLSYSECTYILCGLNKDGTRMKKAKVNALNDLIDTRFYYDFKDNSFHAVNLNKYFYDVIVNAFKKKLDSL